MNDVIKGVVLRSIPIKEHDQIQQSLESALNDLGEGTYYTVITFDNAAFN